MSDSTPPAPNPGNAPLPGSPATDLEQYKAYLEDVANIGSRYTTTNGFYITVLTLLLGIVAFAQPGETFPEGQAIIRIIVSLVAVVICWIWKRTIAYYGTLFLAKFTILRELEQHAGIYPIFAREDAFLKTKPRLLAQEAHVPVLLAGLFLAVVCYAAGSLIWGAG